VPQGLLIGRWQLLREDQKQADHPTSSYTADTGCKNTPCPDIKFSEQQAAGHNQYYEKWFKAKVSHHHSYTKHSKHNDIKYTTLKAIYWLILKASTDFRLYLADMYSRNLGRTHR